MSEHLSPHGLVFVALQVVFILGIVVVDRRIRVKRAAAGRASTWTLPAREVALVLAEYAFLRVQPALMGGDAWHYTLGIFDGVTLMGILLILIHHTAMTPEDT